MTAAPTRKDSSLSVVFITWAAVYQGCRSLRFPRYDIIMPDRSDNDLARFESSFRASLEYPLFPLSSLESLDLVFFFPFFNPLYYRAIEIANSRPEVTRSNDSFRNLGFYRVRDSFFFFFFFENRAMGTDRDGRDWRKIAKYEDRIGRGEDRSGGGGCVDGTVQWPESTKPMLEIMPLVA